MNDDGGGRPAGGDTPSADHAPLPSDGGRRGRRGGHRNYGGKDGCRGYTSADAKRKESTGDCTGARPAVPSPNNKRKDSYRSHCWVNICNTKSRTMQLQDNNELLKLNKLYSNSYSKLN